MVSEWLFDIEDWRFYDENSALQIGIISIFLNILNQKAIILRVKIFYKVTSFVLYFRSNKYSHGEYRRLKLKHKNI